MTSQLSIPNSGSAPPPSCDISVVIPCLNEERTVGRCVEAAFDGIRLAGLTGEVIVADNGSTDGSRERAEATGARLVHVPRRGYGAALQAGFLAAEGRLLVMGDCDLSYDFRHIPHFVEEMERSGADMVVGNRYRGGIMRGAMPLSHRLIGNPLISWVVRRITGTEIGDCYCGLRVITREAHRRLPLNATGMEFALEMIFKGAIAGLSMSEVPTTLRVDGRDRAPHLHTYRDGYRSFRFLFQHAPITAFFLPGVILVLLGAVELAAESWLQLAEPKRAISIWAPLAALALLTGGTLLIVGVLSRVFALGYLGGRVETGVQRIFRVLRLEHIVLLAFLGVAAGIAAVMAALGRSEALLLLGLCAVSLSVLALLSSFLVSLMGRAVPDSRFYVEAKAPPQPGPLISPPEIAASPGGQNVQHSLATQEAMAEGQNYNVWLLDTIAEALDGASSILDVGCSIGNISSLAVERARSQTESGAVRLVGLEVIPEATEAFARRFAESDDMEVIPGSIEDPPEALRARARFDCAISLNVLEHIDDDIGALSRVGALLRPGGRLGLLVPGGGQRLYGTLDALDRHFRRYTPGKLRVRLEEAGFEVISVRSVNFVGYFLWFIKGRILRSKAIGPGEVRRFDRWVPLFRRIDALLGPPTGQSVAAVARWRGLPGTRSTEQPAK